MTRSREKRMRRWIVTTLLASSFGVATSSPVTAGVGRTPYDTSFDGDGRAVVGFPAEVASFAWATDVLVRPDGGVILGGTAWKDRRHSRFAVARLWPDGSPVRSFGGEGRITTRITKESGVTALLDWQPAFLAGGYTDTQCAVVKYSRRGRLDTTFGARGVARLGDGPCSMHDLVRDSADTFLVIGAIGQRPFVARRTRNGLPEPSFGVDGTWLATDAFPGEIRGVQLLTDGRVVVLGVSGAVGSLRVARYASDGHLDPTFAQAGVFQTTEPFDDASRAHVMVELPNGDMVIGGTASTGGDDTYFTLFKLDAAGGIDRSFGDNGWTVNYFGNYYSRINDLALLPDGRIIAVGDADDDTNWRWNPLVACYDQNGTLDRSFGDNGHLLVRFPSRRGGSANAVAVDSHRVFVAGDHAGKFAAIVVRP